MRAYASIASNQIGKEREWRRDGLCVVRKARRGNINVSTTKLLKEETMYYCRQHVQVLTCLIITKIEDVNLKKQLENYNAFFV